jgi:hypothetical protein
VAQFLLALTIVAVFVLIIRSSLRPGKKQLADRRRFIQRAAELGWREAEATEKWRVRLQGTTEGIDWTLSANAQAEEISGIEDEDEIWWSSDTVQSEEFVLVIGYPAYRVRDWAGHSGVQDYEDIDRAMKAAFDQLARAAESLESMGDQWRRKWPWVALSSFLETAHDVPVGRPELDEVVVKARDPELARRLLDGAVVSALDQCRPLLAGTYSRFRIWLGAPNLRLQVTTVCGQRKLEVFQRAVDLGVAVARSYERGRRPRTNVVPDLHAKPRQGRPL